MLAPAGGVQYEDGLEGGLDEGGQGGQEGDQVLLQLWKQGDESQLR